MKNPEPSGLNFLGVSCEGYLAGIRHLPIMSDRIVCSKCALEAACDALDVTEGAKKVCVYAERFIYLCVRNSVK